MVMTFAATLCPCDVNGLRLAQILDTRGLPNSANRRAPGTLKSTTLTVHWSQKLALTPYYHCQIRSKLPATPCPVTSPQTEPSGHLPPEQASWRPSITSSTHPSNFCLQFATDQQFSQSLHFLPLSIAVIPQRPAPSLLSPNCQLLPTCSSLIVL